MDKLIRDFKELAPDYEPIEGIFNDEPDKVRRLKKVISELDQVDRTLILLYADCGSYRKLGVKLGLSHGSVKRIIDGIRTKILDRYFEMVAKEIR